jgi:ABC-2 type transport system ATP-binding protein
MYYGSLQGIASGMLRDEVDRRLEEVHLSDRARHKVRTLSHGMRRRLTIAQALLGDPELVLLDEPMNGLDPREVANTRRLLHARRGKQTLVISSHLLTEVEAVCDHVAFMENGKRVRQGTLAEIVRNKHQITYHLESGPIPRKELEAALPGITVSISEDGHALCLGFARATLTTGHVNAVALPILLRNDVVVLEVRRGSSLEHEYLESRSGGSAKPHPPCPDAIG